MLIDKLFSYTRECCDAAGDEAVAFSWAGNAGWLICHKGGMIAIDPDLMSERLWGLDAEIGDIARHLDYVLATHAHGDHFNTDTFKFMIDHGNGMLVLPRSCSDGAEKAGMPESRIIWAVPGQPLTLGPINKTNVNSGRVATPAPWLRLEPTRALHGHIGRSVYDGANFDDCGYIISIGGKRLYHPGDSVLLHEHLRIRDIDILFVSPTEHNMHIDGSRTFIEAINPARIYAQHFGTYPVTESNAYWTTGYEEPLRLTLSSKHRSRYVIPDAGAVYCV
jgi:L-ascorbate metabolism protein UlaG (beta-lactamase superfamily)